MPFAFVIDEGIEGPLGGGLWFFGVAHNFINAIMIWVNNIILG